MKKLTKSQFTKELSELVSINTLTSDIARNKEALDYIQAKISKKAFIKRIKNGSAEILIASNKETKTPDVCFMVHVDVVSGKPEQFSMKIKDGIAYGRGVSDMKFSIPIGYALLNEVLENKSAFSFSFIVTTDEETGGFEGAKYLANEYGLSPKVFIVPDGGDDFVFVNKSKGVCALRINSVGKPAHASRVWDGENAIEPLIELCSEVLKKYKQNNKKESWRTTVNIGKLHGGISINQVCPEAYVTLDFRFPETTTFETVYSEIELLAKSISPNLTLGICSKGSPTFTDKNSAVVKLFIESVEKIIKRKVEIKGTHGASDARHFSHLNVPVLMIKPNGGDIHGDNEHIEIDSCLNLYEATRTFLQKLEK
jgi:succinyl-diaminopimelate desuccinylase